MINVYVSGKVAGNLFESESDSDRDSDRYKFGYREECLADCSVSLSMPISSDHYISDYKTLHPIFDMNLPEGALADRLRKAFSKAIPNFSDLSMLKIVGKSQIIEDIPGENIRDLLAHDGAEGLLESLLDRYATYSGISGAMPKVMVRSDSVSRLTSRGATHIIKAWINDFPRLAENEYFCMRAAMHSKLEVPKFELSKGGKFLVVERFRN